MNMMASSQRLDHHKPVRKCACFLKQHDDLKLKEQPGGPLTAFNSERDSPGSMAGNGIHSEVGVINPFQAANRNFLKREHFAELYPLG